MASGERRIHPNRPLPGGLTWGEARAFVAEAVREARQEESRKRGIPEARPSLFPEPAPPRR